jgi:predicted AlkP superfamily pyrophosphatase or phosphodiesterase
MKSPTSPTWRWTVSIGASLALWALCARAHAGSVLMIAVDGLRPSEIVIPAHADWSIPNLRALVHDGASASGVRGVLPTLTLPSMATLITGTPPGEHGIVGNYPCDGKTYAEVKEFLYADRVKTQTLWQATERGGLRAANVGWTSSVGAQATYNLPRVWDTTPSDRYALQAAQSTPGLLAALEPVSGAGPPKDYLMDDDRRALYGERIIELYGPDLLTVFFENLDDTEHESGIDTPQARRALEHIDVLIGRLVAAARKKHSDTAVVIVSDHGFSSASVQINLFKAFADSGLPSVPDGGTNQKVWLCSSHGTVYVALVDPNDVALRTRVTSVLKSLQSRPDYGIVLVMNQPEIRALGGFARADFMIAFRLGYVASTDPAAPLRGVSDARGMHGYLPTDPSMFATFILDGGHTPLKGNLGIVDMRDIAPTVAKVLGVKLESAATGKPLF